MAQSKKISDEDLAQIRDRFPALQTLMHLAVCAIGWESICLLVEAGDVAADTLACCTLAKMTRRYDRAFLAARDMTA
jgi:hypothetical protein